MFISVSSTNCNLSKSYASRTQAHLWAMRPNLGATPPRLGRIRGARRTPIIEIRNYLYLLHIYQNPNRKLEVVKVLGRVIGLI